MVQRQRSRADDDFVRTELAPQRVDGLLQRVTCPFLVAFRPEMEQQLVTAEPGRTRGREHRQQRQPATLRGWTCQRRAVSGQRQPAKRRQAKQVDLECGERIETY